MPSPWLTLRGAVLVAIVGGVGLPAALALAIDTFVMRGAHQPVVERARAAVMALSAAALAEPVWTLSIEGLNAAVDQIRGEPSVCGIELALQQAAGGLPPVHHDRCPAAQATDWRAAAVRYEGQTLAILRLRFDDGELDRMLAERRRTTLLLVLAQVLLGGLVIAGLLSARLLRPIEALKQQADELVSREGPGADGPAAPSGAKPPAWAAADELGALGRHLSDVHARVRSLIGELELKNAELERMAMHDHLTGLPNRTLLRELFQVAAAHARRDDYPVALMFIDLDAFKSVNDSHGHAAGDALLQTTARRLRQALRESDVVGRMSGDEFLAVLPGATDDEAAMAAARVQEALSQPVVLDEATEPVRASASIGIARFPLDATDFDALVQAADLAMYRSKQQGPGLHGFHHADFHAALRARRTLAAELGEAIEAGQLVLHYQPIVDPGDGRIVGAEALVRWAHPLRGLLMPDQFIALAEETRLIASLGHCVLEEACAALAAWRAAGHAALRLSVNVSAVQLRDATFPAQVIDVASRHALAPGSLELELTESTLLADGEATQRAVSALRTAGVGLAVDDFGTGYSSLATLKRLRPDRVKIDRSFVRDLPESQDDGALVLAMFGMARALGIDVVAEGVETAAQRDWLRHCGPHLQQGWLWARAMPGAAFAEALARPPVTPG